jgi:hypothetical protein
MTTTRVLEELANSIGHMGDRLIEVAKWVADLRISHAKEITELKARVEKLEKKVK